MDKHKGWMIVAGIVLSGFGLFVGGMMPWLLFYIYLLFIMIPWVHCRLSLIKLSGKVEVPRETFYIGETVTIQYRVVNNSLFHLPYVEIQSRISERLTGQRLSHEVIGLKSKDSYYKSEKIVLKRRGYYELGDIKITVRDIFGLFSFEKTIASSISLIVYPEVINLSTFDIIASHQMGDLSVKDPMFMDKSRTSSMRVYQEGDAIKRIHWKLSAKRDDLIVKTFDNRGDTNVVVMMDNEGSHFINDVDRHIEDKIVEIGLSLIAYCLNHHIEVQLMTQSKGHIIQIVGMTKDDLKPFLEAMAFFKANGTRSFKDFINPQIESIRKGTTVVMISPHLDKTMGATGIRLKMNNLNPLMIYVSDISHQDTKFEPEVENKLGIEGVKMYRIDYKMSTKDVLEGHHG